MGGGGPDTNALWFTVVIVSFNNCKKLQSLQRSAYYCQIKTKKQEHLWNKKEGETEIILYSFSMYCIFDFYFSLSVYAFFY